MRKAAEIREAFADCSKLNGCKSFFLVGIGGAGMSALARMLKHRGYSVVGTDSTQSPETDRLQAEGISVRIGHSGEGISDKQGVVLTDAIDLSTSPEVARAREIGAPLFRRSQVLGWLLRDNYVIAVTGTHGKTTTTGMIGAGLKASGMDPLIVVGAAVPEFGGPVYEGRGSWAVVEACEAYDSFHDITPNIVVLTNLELDHVDYHGSWEHLRDSVVRFVESIDNRRAPNGFIYNCESDGAQEVTDLVWNGEGCFSITPYRSEPMIVGGGNGPLAHEPLPTLRLPGIHNRSNAEGALIACIAAGADEVAAARGIANFGGAERRLQVLQEEPVTVIDDYAHHPTEIEASLKALNDRYPFRRLIVVYQPHLYSRTEPLIQEFADALSLADEVVITDIYPAREAPIPGVSSARIAELIKKPVHYIPNRHLLPRKVAAMVRTGDVVVGMGAGNIAEFAPALIKELQRSSAGFQPAFPNSLEGCATKVAVIYGGDSAEREVSLLSGRCVYEALKRKGYDARLIDVSEILIRSGDLSQFTGPDRPDVAFLAVHGTNAEDGAIQGLFELLHVPYTGSGIQASALAMDKQLTKALLREKGIRVPEGRLITRDEVGGNATQWVPDLGRAARATGKWIVKPNAQGSTVGLSFVEKEEDLKPAIARALQYDEAVLVEEWIVGMEISVPVLGDRALPPVEIAPVSGRYDFESKYTPGATEEIIPARLPDATLKESQAIALKAHRALGCQGATRTDMIVSNPPSPNAQRPTHPEIFTLEVNTLPGMTATSLLPNSANAAGIEFDDLVQWLVEDALNRHAKA
ncbi:MAG: UDP-N-acetylmuramate--L-alanine ligase [Fimbriimonadales bacterium]